MIDMFGVKFLCHPAKHPFDQIAVIPFAFLTVMEILWGAVFLPKPQITEGNRLVVVGKCQFTEGVSTTAAVRQ